MNVHFFRKSALPLFVFALLAILGQQSMAQDWDSYLSSRSGQGGQARIDLGSATLTALGGGRWLLNDKRSGQDRTVEEQDLESLLLGRRWLESEAGYAGDWTRRGRSNAFDAIWTGPSRVSASLQITMNGTDQVEIVHRGTSDGNDCRYTGRFVNNRGTFDATRVSGTYTCRNGGPFPWSATIER